MKKLIVISALVALVFTGITAKELSDSERKAKAKDFVERAIKLVQKEGNEKACAVFTDPKGGFIEDDYYISHLDLKGVVICHGAKKEMMGKNMWELKDAKGTLLVQELIKAVKTPKGEGLVSFYWPSPVTKKVAMKTSFAKKIPGKEEFIHVGVYVKK